MQKLIALSLSIFLAAPAFPATTATPTPVAPPAAGPNAAPSALPAAAVNASASERFSQLAEEYWDMEMRLSPLSATYYGYPKYNDRLDDIGAAGRAEDLRSSKAMLQKLLALDRSALNDGEKVSYDIMQLELQRRIDWHKHKFWQWNVDHMDGGQSWIPTVIAMAQPMKTAEDAEALLVRIKSIPGYFADQTANLREGLKDGRVAAKVPVEKLIDQLDGLIKTPADKSPIADAVERLPADLKAQYGPRIFAAIETHLIPAYKDYQRFLKEEYLPHARDGNKIGLSGLPGGDEAYQYMIRYHTTTDMPAEKIHHIGLEELDGIHKELQAVAKRMKYKGDMKSFLQSVRSDPKNFFTTREEVLRAAEDIVAEAKTKLPLYFGNLPRTPMVVKPVESYKEKNEVAARYDEVPDDLSRPGIYYINTYKPETRPRFAMVSLAAHEGVPGHHLQIALQTEHRDLPAFRRHGEFNAFIEGWALYCERLADEMGLYTSDLSRVGMLSDQGLRAARLVVDTGIHALGWPREQAIQFMKDNTALSQDEIEAEVDRYTIWPGQALAYKIGQREIMELRQESKKQLGRKFDIRKFHDDVLKNGAVPLSVLREVIMPGSVKQAAPSTIGTP